MAQGAWLCDKDRYFVSKRRRGVGSQVAGMSKVF